MSDPPWCPIRAEGSAPDSRREARMATEIGATVERATGRAPAPRRRVTLLDLMILVGATALGCAADGWLLGLDGGGGVDLLPALLRMARDREFSGLLFAFWLLMLPVAMAWTVAVIPLGLAGPRPRSRRAARPPGLVAGWAALLAFGVIGLVILSAALVMGRSQAAILLFQGELLNLTFFAPLIVGLTIAAAWLGLVLARRWRPEPTWVDRLGRVAGVAWIGAGLAAPALYFLFGT